MLGLNPYIVPIECLTVCAFVPVILFVLLFLSATSSFVFLTLGWRHHHQNNLLGNFNAL